MPERWKKDPALESALLIATAVHEQSKAQKKSSSSSSSRPAKSLAHQSPLDAPGLFIADPLDSLIAGTLPRTLDLIPRIGSLSTRSALLLHRRATFGLRTSPSPPLSIGRIFDLEGTQDRDHKDTQQSRPFNRPKTRRGGGSGQRP